MTAAIRANSAYHGSANGARASRASRISELKAVKWLSAVVAKWTDEPYSAPLIAAKNDETQNTITRVVLVLRPRVPTATGESARPRSRRPILASWMTTIVTAVTATNARTT